jgi:hypothetical protein
MLVPVSGSAFFRLFLPGPFSAFFCLFLPTERESEKRVSKLGLTRDLLRPPSETAYPRLNPPEVSLIRRSPRFPPAWQGFALIAAKGKESKSEQKEVSWWSEGRPNWALPSLWQEKGPTRRLTALANRGVASGGELRGQEVPGSTWREPMTDPQELDNPRADGPYKHAS